MQQRYRLFVYNTAKNWLLKYPQCKSANLAIITHAAALLNTWKKWSLPFHPNEMWALLILVYVLCVKFLICKVTKGIEVDGGMKRKYSS